MIPHLRHVGCNFLLALLVTLQTVSAANMSMVPVALYASDPEVVEKEGKRAAALLERRLVKRGDVFFNKEYWARWVAEHKTGSAVVLFAPKDRSDDVRLMLARAIKAEGLRITLLDEAARSITVESILEPSKP